ncbi:MAG: hypothetical protein NZ480_01505 [Bdellovibrionaceae bacterium]|nr:hypothetical protein [Pseudobdellovibrionaceae bacterium]MDW8190084.1 hypothetical protein [Pseudobdellovibrionaceae bacterium]
MAGLFNFRFTTVIGCLLLSSCASYLEKSHNRVLVGSGMGGVVALLLAAAHPMVDVYFLAGLGIGGSVAALHELAYRPCHLKKECYPKIPLEALEKGEIVDRGEGVFSNIPELRGRKVIWKLYQSGSWIQNAKGQYLYVDKIVEFEEDLESGQK